jgi:hypothetical protein
LGEIDAGQFARLVGLGQECHETASQHAGEQERHDPVPAVIELARVPGRGQHGDHRDGTARNVQQGRLFRRVSESFDQGRRVSPTRAGGDVAGDDDHDDKPCSRIQHGFRELLAFERLVLDPRFVLAESLDGEDLFVVAEARCHGRIGQDEKDDNSPDDRDEAEHQKHDLLPLCQ